MEVIPIQSGSNGNSYYVRAGSHQFLFDAGITGSIAEKRLNRHGVDIREVSSLFISHGHADHCKSMGIFQRKYGHSLFLTEPALLQARRNHKLGQIHDLQIFRPGESISFGDVIVHTVSTPHDAAGSVAFIIEHQQRRLGILTDIGHAFAGLHQILGLLDAVIIESNYDPDMLRRSRYPIWLKRRVEGKGGHLSNEEAAVSIRESRARLQWVCLCHLSEENNCPELAVRTHREIHGPDLPVHVASRYDVTNPLQVEATGALKGPWKLPTSTTGKKVPLSRQLSLF